MKKEYLFLVLLFFCFPGLSQEIATDSSQIDSVQIIQKEKEQPWQPNPKKAVLYSFIFPGAGQIYNRSWWKTPFIYGGLGLGIYAIVENRKEYKSFQTAYIQRINNDPNAPYQDLYPNDETIKRIRDIYYKRFQLGIIATAAVYLLNGVEAYVDAHLKNFEISEDLSMKLTPVQSLSPINGTIPIAGIVYTFQ